jgi:hypothetical protein
VDRRLDHHRPGRSSIIVVSHLFGFLPGALFLTVAWSAVEKNSLESRWVYGRGRDELEGHGPRDGTGSAADEKPDQGR